MANVSDSTAITDAVTLSILARGLATVISLRKVVPTQWTVLTQKSANAGTGEYIPFTGGEIVIAWNSGATPRNVTLTSTPNKMQRLGDLASAIAADVVRAVRISTTEGWSNVGDAGRLYFQADHAEVMFMVIRPG